MAQPGGSRPVTVSDVQQLVKRKDELEAQIKAYYELLEGQKGVGMSEPLVDAEGFPRDDIDLYQVRTARHNIICEWGPGPGGRALPGCPEAGGAFPFGGDEPVKKWFSGRPTGVMLLWYYLSLEKADAHLTSISVQGLQVDDEIVEFGSVNINNFQNLQNIATVVQHSEGRPLSVTVIRSGKKVHVGLTPKRWAGKGLLG
ncbi:PSMD9 ATPase, partial [Corythaeola cristata]|nr:PSMD9 ATPase [Corythaeola cristata]